MRPSQKSKEGKEARSQRPIEFHTTAARSALMSRVRQRGTAAEATVRKIIAGLGYRYRLNIPGLPGRPDIAHRGKKKAIFVHGCFWHWHKGCPPRRASPR